MGCGASVPKAEVFLANDQPAPPNGYLLDTIPTEGVTMQAWSNFDPGNKYHQQSGAMGMLTTLSVANESGAGGVFNPIGSDASAHYTG